jgi:hypothetical protein
VEVLKSMGNAAVEQARRVVRDNLYLGVAARAVRSSVVLGPLNPLLLSYHQRKNKNPNALKNEREFFEPCDETVLGESLSRLGYCDGPNMKSEYVNEIVEWGKSSDYKRINPHFNNKTIYDMAHCGTLIRMVRAYLGAEPILHCTYLSTVTSKADRPEDTPQNATMFHYDAGDYRSCSVRFYMDDVDDDTAPHVVIGGTHGQKSFRSLLEPHIQNKKAEARYGDAVHKFVGPAGTGWIEDLSCLHRRGRAHKPRQTLSFSYVLSRTPMTENL